MISQQFAVLGVILALAGFGSYVRDMSRGRAEPNRVSWAEWALAPLVAFPAELAQHTRLQVALVTLALGLGPLAVLVVSLTHRECYWKLGRFDYTCAGLAAPALAGWAATRRGDVAIALSIAADGLAALATIRKSWLDPRSESPWTYLASGTGSGITLLTIPHWSFAACGFALYVAAVCTIISALILLPLRAGFAAAHRGVSRYRLRAAAAGTAAAAVLAAAAAAVWRPEPGQDAHRLNRLPAAPGVGFAESARSPGGRCLESASSRDLTTILRGARTGGRRGCCAATPGRSD